MSLILLRWPGCLGKDLRSVYKRKLKHQDKERCHRDSTISSSHDQRNCQTTKHSFILLLPPVVRMLPSFVMLWDGSEAGAQETKRKEEEKKKTEAQDWKRVYLGNLGNKSLSGKLHVGVTIPLQPHSFSPCLFFPCQSPFLSIVPHSYRACSKESLQLGARTTWVYILALSHNLGQCI